MTSCQERTGGLVALEIANWSLNVWPRLPIVQDGSSVYKPASTTPSRHSQMAELARQRTQNVPPGVLRLPP